MQKMQKMQKMPPPPPPKYIDGLKVSTNGRCGPDYNNTRCTGTSCCSSSGWCGGEQGKRSDWCNINKKGIKSGKYDGRSNSAPKEDDTDLLKELKNIHKHHHDAHHHDGNNNRHFAIDSKYQKEGEYSPKNVQLLNTPRETFSNMNNLNLNSGGSFWSLNLLLKAVLFACLFYVLSHSKTRAAVSRNLVSGKENGTYVLMLVFALVYYLLNLFV